MELKYVYAFISGLAIGVPLCFALGTVFFTLIQRSLEKGLKVGIYVALGVIAADIVLIFGAFSGTQYILPDGSMVEFYVQLACCILLFIMGITTIRKVPHYHPAYTPKENSPFFYGFQGFLLNILNPGNFFAWVGVSTYLGKSAKFDFTEHVIFYSASIIAIFTTEVLIAYSAKRLKKFLSDRTMHLINVGTGWLFIGCGVYLGYLAVEPFLAK